MPDARKSLQVLQREWSGCVRCELGEIRDGLGQAQVAGEGRKRGIMFIGPAPTQTDAEMGRVYADNGDGHPLRLIIEHSGISTFYLTYLTACRSCAPVLDGEGNPRTRRDGSIWYKDQAPLKPQIAACLPRLYEEIYLVDPIIIVAMGAVTASALRGTPVNLIKDRGQPETITIPGAGFSANFSEKRNVWGRKKDKKRQYPVDPAGVRYQMVPTLPPYKEDLRVHDTSKDNPLSSFIQDIRTAKSIYERYCYEAYGAIPDTYEEWSPEELREEITHEYE